MEKEVQVSASDVPQLAKGMEGLRLDDKKREAFASLTIGKTKFTELVDIVFNKPPEVLPSLYSEVLPRCWTVFERFLLAPAVKSEVRSSCGRICSLSDGSEEAFKEVHEELVRQSPPEVAAILKWHHSSGQFFAYRDHLLTAVLGPERVGETATRSSASQETATGSSAHLGTGPEASG